MVVSGGLRLNEGIKPISAVYFDMSDIFEWVGDLEVGVERSAGRSSHLIAVWEDRGGLPQCKGCRV